VSDPRVEIVPPSGGEPSEARFANLVYILYLVSLVFGVTALIGVIMAYVNQGDAPGWIGTHYRFQIRTFWIGLLIGVVGGLTAMIAVGWFILLFGLIWIVVRCAKGMKYLARGQAHPDPGAWMFG